ncbi:hypothetical protein [Arthrobacter sp. VKM Ac-2550]|uniref:hypothetical protein n=1 Tax=Crystallibacter permensis TaxID=1938888 RepID=UPI0022276E61|nr:hypothetical protein [Arthrobacter sp. VKM Ac-2550]MCW2130946.1 hypothetical protein [Arthrobacter sp. VKM Ac-2550]
MNTELVPETSRHITIDRLPTWQRLEAEGADLVLAAEPVQEGHFRPNLVVTSFPFLGSIEKFSTMAMANTRARLKAVYFIAVEEWQAGDAPGRRFQYNHRLQGRSVHCQDWIVLTGRRAVMVTASCASNQLGANDFAFAVMADSITVKGQEA